MDLIVTGRNLVTVRHGEWRFLGIETPNRYRRYRLLLYGQCNCALWLKAGNAAMSSSVSPRQREIGEVARLRAEGVDRQPRSGFIKLRVER